MIGLGETLTSGTPKPQDLIIYRVVIGFSGEGCDKRLDVA